MDCHPWIVLLATPTPILIVYRYIYMCVCPRIAYNKIPYMFAYDTH